jgi:hypothetical protein
MRTTFNKKQTGQITELVKRWASADIYQPIDKRKFDRQVVKYALEKNILETRKNNRTYIRRDASWFDPERDLMPELLYAIICEHIFDFESGESTGYSITKNKGWNILNVFERGSVHNTAGDIEVMRRMFGKLMLAGLVWFQTAGTIWRIEKR